MLDSALGRTLEDLFFFERDQSLIAARKKMEQMQETKENLAKVSGIRNDAVLDKLVSLDIRPEILTTLLAVPLVEVAWADGELQEAEHRALLAYAESAGLKNKEIDPATFSSWLKTKPDPALMEAWEHYIHALCSQLSPAERRDLEAEVMADARAVAKAAGGFLGLGRLCVEEQKMLARLEAAFGCAPNAF